ALDVRPRITMDDGADLVTVLHTKKKNLVREIIGGTEETTTGVIRLRSMANKGILRYPIIAVNDAQTKHFFDNRYGTGQSTIDGILRATNRLLAGSNFVVCGYGWCGRGIAMRARGMGARVIVTEVDPLKALEASMDGYQVMPLNEAARVGDIFVTASGDIGLIDKRHFRAMRDGAIVANAGHFNVEINIPALERMAKKKRSIRGAIDQYILPGGKRINLLGEGRLVNLACAEGHPPTVMDMSFANQALSVEYLVKKKALKKKVYPVPSQIDKRIARLKLKSLGIRIDRLTKEQERYLKSWELGT
ncbi:adenosylhomocysteinase, partial [bacterium]|nr:adenosylhomocysteinase [bacterium]